METSGRIMRLAEASEVARRAAMAEAAIARLERGLADLADQLEGLSVDAPQDPVSDLGRRARATLAAERVISELAAGEVPVRAGLERFLSKRQLASQIPRELVTSLMVDRFDPSVAASVAAAIAELVADVDEGIEDFAGGRIYVTSGIERGGVVVAFAAELAGRGPIPARCESSRAFLRAERLVRLAGGTLVRGTDGGREIVGIALDPRGGAGDRVGS